MDTESTIWIPGSKSHTIRAILIAAFSRGVSKIRNPLFSEDTKAAFNAAEKLGAKVEVLEDGHLVIIDSRKLGEGMESVELDMLNSGTTTYLITGLAASLGIEVKIKGDESLSSRPVGPLLSAYEELGAKCSSSGGYPPFSIKGPLKGGKVSIEARTSQFLSRTPLLYEKPYVTMTLSWLDMENIEYRISDDYQDAFVKGRGKYAPLDVSIKGDYSSATFFFVLAAASRRRIRIKGLDRNDSQGDKRVLSLLEEMGASIRWEGEDVIIEGTGKIRGGTYDINDIPDALPALAVLSLFAENTVTLCNVSQARIKETDRIKVMHDELEKAGARIEEMPDGLVIHPSSIHASKLSGHADHRVIMALSVLKKLSGKDIELDDASKASVTFPTFFEILSSIR